jgi:hypothetical protein
MIYMNQEMKDRMMQITMQRGVAGVSRDDLYKELKRGVNYNDLEREIEDLERMGIVTIDWFDACNFLVKITPMGQQWFSMMNQ